MFVRHQITNRIVHHCRHYSVQPNELASIIKKISRTNTSKDRGPRISLQKLTKLLVVNSNSNDAKILSELIETDKLQLRQIPSKEILRSWVNILKKGDLVHALLCFGFLGIEPTSDSLPCPPWLFLQLPNMTKSLNDAQYLVALFLSETYQSISISHQQRFTARVLQALIQVRHYVAVRELVNRIIQTETAASEGSFIKGMELYMEALVTQSGTPGSLSAVPKEFVLSMMNRLFMHLQNQNVEPTERMMHVYFAPHLIVTNSTEVQALLNRVSNHGVHISQKMEMSARKAFARAGSSNAFHGWKLPDSDIVDKFPGPKIKSSKPNKAFNVKGDNTSLTPPELILSLRRHHDSTTIVSHFKNLSPKSHELWIAFFKSLVTSDMISSSNLISIFDLYQKECAGTLEGTPQQHTMWGVLFEAMLKRSEPELVVQLWESERIDAISNKIISGVVRAYCVLGRPEDGRKILDDVSFKGKRAGGRIQLDTVSVNTLMMGYFNLGEYEKVYDLFCTMKESYAVLADTLSFEVFMNSARLASAYAGHGYGPGQEGIAHSELNIKYQNDSWDGRAAWKLAEQRGWEVLERNELSGLVRSPLEKQAWKLFEDNKPSDNTGGFPVTLSPDPPIYPSVFPDNRFFRAFIRLVGYHSRASSIISILAWMKHQGCIPGRRLLAIALLYYIEGGAPERDLKIVYQWLSNWLGPQNVPTEDEIAAIRSGRSSIWKQ